MLLYYGLAALLTLFSLIVLVCTFEAKKTNFYLMILILLIAISNMGYFTMAISTDLSEAALANKICYLGGCFIPLVTLLLTCEICKFKVHRLLKICMYAYSTIVYGMVLTIGFSDIYYKNIYLDKLGDATVLGREYGVGHTFFYVILYGYLIFELLILIYSMARKNAVSRKNLWALIATGIASIVLFLLVRMINPDIEVIPLIYVIDSFIFLYMYRRVAVYNIEDNIAGVIKKQETLGYIMFDNGLRYLGCNNIAVDIFPDLSKCVIDKQVKHISGMQLILNWINEYDSDNSEEFSYEKEDKHYECRVERIVYHKKPYGYMIEIKEDTHRWKYVNSLASNNDELQKVNDELEETVEEKTAELMKQEKKMEELFMQTVTALSEAVDAKDRYTSGHSKRVAKYARMIAARMGKSKEKQEEIYRAGLLHDVGKIRVPAELINKPGKLTDEEYNIIKIHSITGYHILRGISEDSVIAIAAKYHHERYDGKGYPNGLAGDRIPEVARILGIADSYDAMASNRSYRNALPQDVVRSEIVKGMGTKFDPDIAKIMLQMIDEDKDYTMKQTDSMQRKILTVDDEMLNNKIIAHIMKDEPMYEVTSVESGMAALEELKKQSFDLIMLDVKMPGMDGLETLKLIREKYQTPVVLMTSDKTLDTSIEFKEYGCDDYITKPFLPLMIKEVVHNMTERTEVIG